MKGVRFWGGHVKREMELFCFSFIMKWAALTHCDVPPYHRPRAVGPSDHGLTSLNP